MNTAYEATESPLNGNIYISEVRENEDISSTDDELSLDYNVETTSEAEVMTVEEEWRHTKKELKTFITNHACGDGPLTGSYNHILSLIRKYVKG